jgi:hypothetical protein
MSAYCLWILNIAGLLFSTVAAILLLRYAPRRPIFIKTQGGELKAAVEWVRNVTDAEKQAAARDERLSKIAIGFLIAGFVLQLIAALGNRTT